MSSLKLITMEKCPGLASIIVAVFVPLEECCPPSQSCRPCLAHPNSSAGAGLWWSPQHHYWPAGHTRSPRGPCWETWSWSRPWPGWTPAVGRATEKRVLLHQTIHILCKSELIWFLLKIRVITSSIQEQRGVGDFKHLSRRLAVIELGSSIAVSPGAMTAVAAGAAPKQAGHHQRL